MAGKISRRGLLAGALYFTLSGLCGGVSILETIASGNRRTLPIAKSPTGSPTSEIADTLTPTGTATYAPKASPTTYSTATASTTASATGTKGPTATNTVVPTYTPKAGEPSREPLEIPTGHIDDLCSYYGHITEEQLRDPENADKLFIPGSCEDLLEPLHFSIRLLDQGRVTTYVSMIQRPETIVYALVRCRIFIFDPPDEFNSYVVTLNDPDATGKDMGKILFSYMIGEGNKLIQPSGTIIEKGDPMIYIGQALPEAKIKDFGLAANTNLVIVKSITDISNSQYWIGADKDNRPKFLPKSMLYQ